MKVVIVAKTMVHQQTMFDESGDQWYPENPASMVGEGGTLAEFAGRQCYESWNRPNPATATNAGYVGNLIYQEHFSVLEHGSVSFRISGVSRSLTHELVRHRHLSFSQVSQRYVMVDAEDFVSPPLYAGDAWSQTQLMEHWKKSVDVYDKLIAAWMPQLIQDGRTPLQARKMAREAARSVLPNMTPTALVCTGNHRTWREFVMKRGSIHADAEIRLLAVTILNLLKVNEPNIYQDLEVALDSDSATKTLVVINNLES